MTIEIPKPGYIVANEQFALNGVSTSSEFLLSPDGELRQIGSNSQGETWDRDICNPGLMPDWVLEWLRNHSDEPGASLAFARYESRIQCSC